MILRHHSLGFERVTVALTCGIPHGNRQTFQQNFTNFCPFLVFPSCFKIQFVRDKGSKIMCVQYVVIFPLVSFTVFEVYSYLLRRLMVNRELLANFVYLYIYNEYNYYDWIIIIIGLLWLTSAHFLGCLWLQSEVTCTYDYHSWNWGYWTRSENCLNLILLIRCLNSDHLLLFHQNLPEFNTTTFYILPEFCVFWKT